MSTCVSIGQSTTSAASKRLRKDPSMCRPIVMRRGETCAPFVTSEERRRMVIEQKARRMRFASLVAVAMTLRGTR
jgi:hypothetical protein